jgi:peptide/nickel transport system permease protein
MLAIAIVGFPFYTRLVRSVVLSVRSREFVEAARALGAAWPRILLVHILPHLVPHILVWGTLGIAVTVLLEATLSFLGIGVQPPTPSWGGIIFESQSYFVSAPWLVFIPGASILLLALSFNLVGDGLRDALDPTQRGRE